MAERLPSFDFPPAQSGAGYPWDEWMDGSAWKISQGVDYDVSTTSMRAQLYIRATDKGYKVRTRKVQGEDALIFQFVPDPSTA